MTEAEVRAALAAVKDPEIPTASIIDLGIVQDVRISRDRIEIDLLPTFAGCPALDVIKQDVEQAARDLAADVAVRFVNNPPWTTDRVNEDGARALNSYGISAPLLQIGRAQTIVCPYCGSDQTVEESAFGPTPCRTVRYCTSCRNPFEGFKTKLPPTASAS
ncbi:MAG TPA: 1,2-phenylacetyl-CoA epoxidase subunit PaaD [Actinomycetota bacterium]|nr:1,2-phenylacetyl-CoA epoxidase subunit PaaD [Actinomycetota bacterium]